MRKKFWILVTRDHKAKVIALYSPDLATESTSEEGQLISIDQANTIANYRTHATRELQERFSEIFIISPKEFNDLEDLGITPTDYQHWELFEVEFEDRTGCFTSILPATGDIAAVLAMLSGGYITYMALQLASPSENADEKSSLNGVSIFGTCLNSFISLIIYLSSDARKVLTEIGQSIDFACNTLRNQQYQTLLIQNEVNNQHRIKNLMYGFAVMCISLNTIIAGVTSYQECSSLVDRFLKLNPDLSITDREHREVLIKWLVVNTFVFVSSYTNQAFQSGFAIKLVNRFMDSKQPGLFFKYCLRNNRFSDSLNRHSERNTEEETISPRHEFS